MLSSLTDLMPAILARSSTLVKGCSERSFVICCERISSMWMISVSSFALALLPSMQAAWVTSGWATSSRRSGALQSTVRCSLSRRS